MTTAGFQGRTLEISVAGWRYALPSAHRYRLYAVVRYGQDSQNTKTCHGGTRDAAFNEIFKFQFTEDLHEFDIAVWRKSRLGNVGKDKLIAFRKIRLEDQVLGGMPSRKIWQLHHPPEQGADVETAGEVTLGINCPLVHPVPIVLPSPSAPYGYPHG